ncbi:hypothetical protein SAY86_014377 [Trapa natans]|uniref:Kinesin motor domain-containing protein n=1 Tax=Trapa natans TaxID=22666 RepID=A0AAN7KSM2_TRANT|nr:hypothetical protein SAY86_014377 [Trapa natans]
MGQIAGEELTKLEKMQIMSAREEKILVLVRLRPLSEKEVEENEEADWECINDTTILYRESLREGSLFPSAYTFDRAFRGDCTTNQVYEEGVKQIALSVLNGINSSIFAYGQTSSGKTYTMNGVTEQTVAEIFDYIQNHEERAFVLKFSAIEIYNEAIRDLLSSDSTPLRLRDDPERGTIVEKVTEETLRGWNHFNELVSACQAQRQIGETSLNEKSSRSHQILRLIVESSAREFLGKDSSTTLIASVNFVDLAGTERASQISSAGTRLKEGCHINRSLLTLGTVIRKLSKGKIGHINYRDSKLTRILQPALGGNARTAIICTLSPARSHVEQTRNTLMFASCAKEVTTKAQVNIVMSDKALVKHLQKELARLENELRCPAPASAKSDYAGLLRKKDMQIEKLEREITDLIKQRDHAQSHVTKLLLLIGDDQDTKKSVISGHHPNWEDERWEGNCSESESSLKVELYGENTTIKKLKGTYNNAVIDENSIADGSPPQLGYTRATNREYDTDGYCKDVQCLDTVDSAVENLESVVHGDVASQNPILEELNENGPGIHFRNISYPGSQEQRLNDVQRTIDSLDSSLDELYSAMGTDNISNFRNLILSNSRGCRDGALEGISSVGFEEAERIPMLARNDSQSSIGSLSIGPSIGPNGDEDMISMQTFVTRIKEMANAYEKQLAEDSFVASADWSIKFEMMRRMVIEMWHACNVPLVHRTYFFLLFRGDPGDAIYMEVELRRLTFMKEMFADESQTTSNSQNIIISSSLKALNREKQKLSRLMETRLSEEVRVKLFQKWGIRLESKKRRLQLVNCLWTKVNDMEHVMESASIVAKLVRFMEQGQTLKGMLGLSLDNPPRQRWSLGWMTNVMASLL